VLWKTIYHRDLKASRDLRGETPEEIELKAQWQMEAWRQKWEKIQQAEAKRRESEKRAHLSSEKKELAARRTREAQEELATIENILREGIETDHLLDWDSLKSRSPFSVPRPLAPAPDPLPPPPPSRNLVFQPSLSFWDKLIPSRRARRVAAAAQKSSSAMEEFRDEQRRWKELKSQVEQLNKKNQDSHLADVKNWKEEKLSFEHLQREQHAKVDSWHAAYQQRQVDVLTDYWELVLSRSEYPDSFPKSLTLDYLPDSKMLIVEYHLPDISCLPTLKELKYIATRNQFQEVRVAGAWLNRVYDDVLYQITLRTIYELFQSDSVDALSAVVFNGWVNSIDKSTGQEVNACILSVQVAKTEFTEINLANVEPKACFKKLKGVSASKLISLSPVKPILQLSREDKRFVPSYGVAAELDDSVNLAAMDWLDFENLIREIFEKEFSQNGGEVKITRASRDGGVDAIAFDPDPIRGGKIVIQAKRYTNTVGVSAVRDLFGTVHNEGAIKGILVTTSDYGPDAYEFANGKPLALLSGSQLLYLLEKHGHRAKIDLADAKRLLAEQEQATGKPKKSAESSLFDA
jgi:restriction system protein